MKKHIAILMLLLSATTYAQDNPSETSQFSKTYEACIKKAGSPGFYDQSASSQCVSAEIKFQKNRINVAYNKLLKLWADNPDAIANSTRLKKLGFSRGMKPTTFSAITAETMAKLYTLSVLSTCSRRLRTEPLFLKGWSPPTGVTSNAVAQKSVTLRAGLETHDVRYGAEANKSPRELR